MNMARTRNIALDLGGSFIKCSDGRKVPVDSAGSREAVASAVREAVGPTGDLSSVRVCVPGPFDYKEGIFLMRHKFASVFGESFREVAGIPEEVETTFIHDVVAPLRGFLKMCPELRQGTVALVTIGTGLGFSHAVDGVVALSERLSPAFSLYNLPFGGGILEDHVSRRGLLRHYKGRCRGDVEEIAALARHGDGEAMDAFTAMAGAFAQCAGPHLKRLGITTLMFGGQISKAFDLMEGTLKEALPGMILREAKDYDRAVLEGLK